MVDMDYEFSCSNKKLHPTIPSSIWKYISASKETSLSLDEDPESVQLIESTLARHNTFQDVLRRTLQVDNKLKVGRYIGIEKSSFLKLVVTVFGNTYSIYQFIEDVLDIKSDLSVRDRDVSVHILLSS